MSGLRVEAIVAFSHKVWDTFVLDRVFPNCGVWDDFSFQQELFAEACRMMPDENIVHVGIYHCEEVDEEPAPACGAHC